MRKAAGVLVALAVLGGAAAATRGIEARGLSVAREEAGRAAIAARKRAADALRLGVRKLEIRASAAATLSPLVAQLALIRQNRLEGEVASTLQDWFASEPPWAPFRRDFPVYGLAVDGNSLALVGGMEPRELSAQSLIEQAREREVASDLLMAGGRPHAAAAARMTVVTLPRGVVVLLARPIDEEMLAEAAEQAGGAVLLSDGKRTLVRHGPASELESLAGAVGREGATSPPMAEDGSWAAAAAPLAPGLWLWVRTGALATARTAEADATTTKAITWSAAGVLAVLALVFGLRRRPSGSLAGVAGREEAPAASGTDARALSSPGQRVSGMRPSGEASSEPVSGVAATLLGNPAPPASVGQPFGRYLLLARLGEGGMSQVYTAVTFGAEGFRRKFVVKRLRPELANDPTVVAQFTDEANLASTLVHSNIVPVFDFGKEGDEYFLATEYILGRDLGRLTQKLVETSGRTLPPHVILYCAYETLKALEYAHTKAGDAGQPLGIVHRDVSPGNILISARGEVKLFDFGIVKAQGRVTRTQHGVVKGNVSFMSPEQARGTEVDNRADLFSLGLVMYFCLTGDVLYQGNTTYEILLKAATGPGAEEQPRLRSLPAPARDLIARALEVDPARRYATAGEFATGIAPHLHGAAKELADLMHRLFAAEFRDEEKRFGDAVPSASGAGLASGSSAQGGSRRS